MVRHLITGRLHNLLGPSANVTEFKFDHVAAGLTDDVVVVILQFTELVSGIRASDDFEGHSQ